MKEKDKELNELLEELANNLDITETEDAAIRESYKAVGEFLAEEDTLLDKYDVEIFPKAHITLVRLSVLSWKAMTLTLI